MAATDIPPTPLLLRIPGMKGDQGLGGFNVQSFDWQLEMRGAERSNPSLSLTRLVDGASPTISMAFALRKNLASEATLTVVDATGAEVVSYLLKGPSVIRHEINATVGGNERATEQVQLAPIQLTITIAKTKRSTVI